MRVLKFGGSSLATADCIRQVARIILGTMRREPAVIVVSAFQGVTNELLECARLAEKADGHWESLLRHIVVRHQKTTDRLMGKSRSARLQRKLAPLFKDLRDALHGVQLLNHAPPRARDLIASFGERLSALIIASYLNTLRNAQFVDARELISTDDNFTSANVIFSATNRAIRRYFSRLRRSSRRAPIALVTGFIASTTDGQTTTLGRDGSDYTAAILGAALSASAVEIWTDVDGVLSADPNQVLATFTLPRISYEEAMELSYFGAKVLHSGAIAPAVARGIPILIKNTFRPNEPGTLIASGRDDERVVKGISSIGGVTLLNLRGLSMVGVPGVAERLFRALASRRVNVILISQASSEHTICFAVRAVDSSAAVAAVRHEFLFEFQHQLISLDEKPDQAIVAVVGDGMKGHPGVSGKIFGSLGRRNINITAIAQGASERNVSFVVDAGQQARVLNIIHEAFFEVRKRLALMVIGVGYIGTALLEQLRTQRTYLRARGFDVTVVGLADSKKFVLHPDGIDLSRWRQRLSASRRKMNCQLLAREISKLELTDAAIVDCTAAESVVAAYPEFVRANLHIITPNKRANVLPRGEYAALMELLQSRQKYFLDEANVGAGLPIMSTIRDLVASGDVIKKIEGIFSGTLSYLFNNFDGSVPFSSLVKDAWRRGLTEPDPRDDLSGQDVARKLLILARQTGSQLDIADVDVETLVPRSLARGPFSQRFFVALARFDAKMTARLKGAHSRGSVLRYVGSLTEGRAQAKVQEFRRDHPIAMTKGSDNIITFHTKRYSQTPLVIQGPGAGPDVTAMGVFSDILKLFHYLPH
ncbi:MAG TPA: bifunctional aspartate kinase/homoserine dehydrogenase I [Candidatus Udaeobacter sp.]|jgi:aspartokinase/homoserine dehydrogenase 1